MRLKIDFSSHDDHSNIPMKYRRMPSSHFGICRVVGIIFLLGGLLACYAITQDQLSCHRLENVCLLQSRHFWESDFTTQEKIALSDVKGAYVAQRKNRGNKGRTYITYFVKIRTTGGDKQLFHSSSSNYEIHQAAADQINDYLKSNTEELVMKNSALWFLFPLIFVFTGLFIFGIPYFVKKQNKKKENPIVER